MEKICGQRCPRRVKLKYPDTDIRSNQAVRKKDDMRYKLAIFDLDGTILDTLEDLADSTNYALSVYHMPEHTIDEVRWFVGNGIHKLIERAVPKGSRTSQ